MAARRLFIFVEGSDDVRFFETIIKPRFQHAFESVELITFACTKSVKVDRFIRGINAMHHSYIIVTDIDFEKSVPAKKNIILSRFSEADYQHIMVIIQEIERAGISPALMMPGRKHSGSMPLRVLTLLRRSILSGGSRVITRQKSHL